jgi:hypothetical protein
LNSLMVVVLISIWWAHTVLFGWWIRHHSVVNIVICPLRMVVGLARIDDRDMRRILIDKHLISVILCLKYILMSLGGPIWIIFFEILKRTRL